MHHQIFICTRNESPAIVAAAATAIERCVRRGGGGGREKVNEGEGTGGGGANELGWGVGGFPKTVQ